MIQKLRHQQKLTLYNRGKKLAIYEMLTNFSVQHRYYWESKLRMDKTRTAIQAAQYRRMTPFCSGGD